MTEPSASCASALTVIVAGAVKTLFAAGAVIETVGGALPPLQEMFPALTRNCTREPVGRFAG